MSLKSQIKSGPRTSDMYLVPGGGDDDDDSDDGDPEQLDEGKYERHDLRLF